MTDDNGTVQFTTIYPSWYEGRAIHIHVKARAFEGSNETLEWTSQFYLNNSINELVHSQPPVSHIKDIFRCFGNLTVAIRFFLLP
jgi:protocatechuate 3,4-dioxygenase beta subunit